MHAPLLSSKIKHQFHTEISTSDQNNHQSFLELHYEAVPWVGEGMWFANHPLRYNQLKKLKRHNEGKTYVPKGFVNTMINSFCVNN